MKKIVLLMLCILLTCCSANKKQEQVESTTAEEIVEEEKKIDHDVSMFSDTTIYAFVSDVVNNISEYEGDTVKIRGVFRAFHSDYLDKDYYVCMIQDTTACCSQGMEFILNDGDYPIEGKEIILTGVVDTYLEGNERYCYLSNATID